MYWPNKREGAGMLRLDEIVRQQAARRMNAGANTPGALANGADPMVRSDAQFATYREWLNVQPNRLRAERRRRLRNSPVAERLHRHVFVGFVTKAGCLGERAGVDDKGVLDVLDCAAGQARKAEAAK